MAEEIWVAGDGRSGTTWLANLINWQGRLRFLFEPFHPLNEPGMAPFGPFPYLRPGAAAPQFEAYTRSVFSPEFQSEWSARFATGSAFDGVLVKCIFSNLFLGWADRILPDVRKILLLRHPCAVAASKLSLSSQGWGWETQAARFPERAELREDYLLPHESLIRQVQDDPFQHYVLSWAILNKVPLQQMREDRLHVVFYEDLCTDPERELRRLFHFLGRPNPDTAWNDEAVRFQYAAPSQTSDPVRPGMSMEERIAGWTQQVSPQAVALSMEILEAFGLGHLYCADPLPIHRR
jgi:hypothetical protein